MACWKETTATDADLRLLILLTLRLKGIASFEMLTDTLCVDSDVLLETLDCYQSEGLVGRREGDGPGGGWFLTTSGRADGERLLNDQILAESQRLDRDIRSALFDLYEGFLPLNRRLLDICTRWQVRSQDPVELNDHDDPDYDAAVLDELRQIDGQVQWICGQLEGQLTRFSRYRSGFEYALARVRNGAVEWFTKPTLPSYHTLWFELHEDLLATLGLDRAAETARQNDPGSPQDERPQSMSRSSRPNSPIILETPLNTPLDHEAN